MIASRRHNSTAVFCWEYSLGMLIPGKSHYWDSKHKSVGLVRFGPLLYGLPSNVNEYI